jgi:D-xylose transport system permease protein
MANPDTEAQAQSEAADQEAPVESGLVATAPQLSESLGDYLSATWKRIKSGESGVLPVIAGLVIIIIIFQSQESKFLSAGNLVNLLVQSSYIIVFAMAEIWVLILGDIDLSVGYMAAIGATVTGFLATTPDNMAWWLAILFGLLTTTVIGAVWGTLVIRVKLPSFVVTLAGLLGLQGVLLYLISRHGTGGTIRVTSKVLLNLTNGQMTPLWGWILTIAAVGVYALFTLLRDLGRRRRGLVAPPLAVTVLKIAAMAAVGIVLVLVCNADRGTLIPLKGVPYVVPVVVAILVIYTFMLNRTRFGRYLYAMGGNTEAARRAGVSLGWNRLWAFVLTGFTAGIGGIIYMSQLGSISSNVDGGTLVLNAVAAAVIGGASLFGGRGKMIHAALGGLVIATIYNGMALIGLQASYQYMVTALVLLAAVTIDSLARRGNNATV